VTCSITRVGFILRTNYLWNGGNNAASVLWLAYDW